MKKIYLLPLLLALILGAGVKAQTTLISATGDGGFETGSTIIANSWVAVNSTTDQWTVGSVPTTFAGSNCAYISGAPAGDWVYSQVSTIQHLYKEFTVPAGQGVGTLNFKWKALGEGLATSDWDNMKVFIIPSSTNPVANTALLATNQISGPGAVSGMYKLNSATWNDETISFAVTAGVTYRLVFSWKSDITTIANPPAALDNVSLEVRPSVSVTSTTLGGLWSSPATWVGGVVPNGDDATIADGAVVTVDQVASVRDLTIGQGTSGILQWNGTANALTTTRNILVSPGANLNMFTAATTLNGVTVNVGGNFTNNGTVHAAHVGASHSLLNFNGAGTPTSVLSGTGNFVGGIISGLFFQNLGSNSISTTQNLITRSFALTAGALNTNGKLSINNTAQFYGQPINQRVYEIAVTNMGSGYNSATPPTLTIAAPTGVGVNATAVPNIDDVTGTLRSITITNAGDGYRSNPTVTISGGTGSGAVAIAIVNVGSTGTLNGLTQKSGAVTLTGGLNITSNQSVGAAFVTNGGVGYTSAPEVGFALPTGYLNLVTNGGSGYTSAPTVTVSGGIALTGSTNPTFTVVVAQGMVISVIASGGGTLWQVPPVLTLTGGGGSGAAAEFPANCLATATASISNEMVNNITITNPGYGYVAAPNMGLVGGGFTTVAAGATSRVGLYNITMSWFSPAVAVAVHQDDATIPANRRINALTMGNGGLNLGSGLELYAGATAVTLTNGLVDAGANTIYFSHPAYAGVTGTVTSSINGTIRLSAPGGSVTRTFPFDAPFVAVTGTGSLATGSTVTSLTVSRTGAPSGAAIPAGSATGTRAYRVVTNTGAIYGTNPTVTLNFNATDALFSDAQSLTIGQSAALTGPWTVRSIPTGTGSLPATGSRTTATAAPGPIVPTGDDFYAWTTTTIAPVVSATSGNWNDGATWVGGVVPSCADNVQISATHNITVNSAANVSRSLTIAVTGTLTLTSGDLTVGCTLKNNSFVDNGTVTVNGGTLYINGNLSVNAGAKFNQSGGNITIDGNDAGVAGTSVASGTPIVNLAVTTNTDINLTGGTVTIVDPHVATTTTFNASYGTAGSIITGTGHTFRFGDGVSSDPGSANGFLTYSWAGTGVFTFGNVVIAGGPGGTNRFVNLNGTYYTMIAAGDISIESGGELRQTGTTAVTGAIVPAGNLNVNAGGTLIAAGMVYFGKSTAATGTTVTLSPSTIAQSFNGGGLIQNAVTGATGNVVSLAIDNTNAAGVTLNVPITLSSNLNLVNGILNTTPTNLISVGYNAATLGTITRTTGMVNGPLKKWYGAATGTATLPLSDGTNYKPATIAFTTAPATAGSLTASFSAVAPNFPNAAPLTEGALIVNKASTQGSWFVEAGDGLTGGTYTGAFTGNGTTDVIDYTKTVLIKRPSAGGDWTLDGTHVASTGSNSAPVVSRTGMSSFSEFAIGGELLVALPISIEYFKGSKQSNGHLLDWKVTCYNSPSVTMILERSTDGRNFKPVNSQTETSLRCLQPFSFVDASPLAGITYYRLKSVDVDGKVTYSTVVALLNKEKGFEIVNLVPNPVSTDAVLSVTSANKSIIEIVVSDISGKQLNKQRVSLISGNNLIPLNVRNLPAGTYQVTGLTADGVNKTLRFVKQ